jgi:hypothetical protein
VVARPFDTPLDIDAEFDAEAFGDHLVTWVSSMMALRSRVAGSVQITSSVARLRISKLRQ